MRYVQLTDDQLSDIRRQKLLEVEAEHARLALDLDLAAGVGIQSEQVTMGRANLALLERQHAALMDLLSPPTEDVSDNGSSTLVAPSSR